MAPSHLRDGEIDNGGVLLHKEVVLGEALDAEDQIGRQLHQLEPLQEVLLVGFVLLREGSTDRPCVAALDFSQGCFNNGNISRSHSCL